MVLDMLHRKDMQVLEILRTGGSKYIFKFKLIPGLQNEFMYCRDESILLEEGWDMKILEILVNLIEW